MSHKDAINYVDFLKKHHYLQGNLLVSHKGKILVEESYGQASIELDVPNTSKTVFKIASLTKAFTAMLLFILQERGLVDINHSITYYLPELDIDHNVTVYHCLTCSSGIPDYCAKENYWEETMRLPITANEIVNSISLEKLKFPPGSQYDYSSTGYLILTKIIEKVTNSTFEKVLRHHILAPLRMDSSGVINALDIVQGLADSYGFWIEEIQCAKTNMASPTGAAGMYSTIGDLKRWAQAILSRDFLSVEVHAQYERVFRSTYACGWDVATIKGRKFLQHKGDLDGFVSSIKISREEDLIIIFLSNVEIVPTTIITRRIAELILGDKFSEKNCTSIKLENSYLANLSGTYCYVGGAPDKEEIMFSWEKEQLFYTVRKRYAIPYKFLLIPSADEQLRLIFRCNRIDETFEVLANGELNYTDYEGRQHRLKKMKSLM